MILPPPLRRFLAWLGRPKRILPFAADPASRIPARLLAPAVWLYRDGASCTEIAELLDTTPRDVQDRIKQAHDALLKLEGGDPTVTVSEILAEPVK